MSYFFSTVNYAAPDIDQIDRYFSDFLASPVKTHFQANNISVVSYIQPKVIKDIFIKHDKSDSWLTLIGMPLLEYDTDHNLQILLENFFRNPTTTIINEIDGHFCLFAYDALRKAFIAATDFNNFVPIFYSSVGNKIIFSSSELVLAKFLQSDLDPFGFSQAIHFGVTWHSVTRFKHIKKMYPCEIITVNEQKEIHSKRYWEAADEGVWPDNFDVALDRWMSILRDSVLLFYNKAAVKETIWTDFTGGEDARLLVAQCHALGLPYKARVGGFEEKDKDVEVAARAAQQSQIDLIVDPYCQISQDQVLTHWKDICLSSDGYGSFFYTCTRFARNAIKRPLVFDYLHFSGVPGGEAFRGTYYGRAKLLFPAKLGTFDYKFFTRLKFLLNYLPSLTSYSSTDFLEAIYSDIKESLIKVEKFPIGLQVDHLLREFQTCVRGLYAKRPFYLPLGLKHMTASIYNLSPRYKKGGRLTKACTESLFPALASTKTVNHIPTIRKSIPRAYLFFPEYYSLMQKVGNGFIRRVMHLQQTGKTLSLHHRLDVNRPAMMIMLNCKPYSDWFSSYNSMMTGRLYNWDVIDKMLQDAKQGKCNYVEVMGRIINQEIATRYIYNCYEGVEH
jgi:hypothetical protein